MKIGGIKKFVVLLFVAAGLAASLSSCNRGIGCPSDFSVEQIAIPIVKQVVQVK